MSDIKFTSHCAFEGLCNQYCPPYNNRSIPCNGKNKNTEKRCQYDSRSNILTEQSACPFTEECEDYDCCWPCGKWFLWHDNQMREEGAKAEREELIDKFLSKLSGMLDSPDLKPGQMQGLAIALGTALDKRRMEEGSNGQVEDLETMPEPDQRVLIVRMGLKEAGQGGRRTDEAKRPRS